MITARQFEQEVVIKKVERKRKKKITLMTIVREIDEKVFGEMKQETFNNIMYGIIYGTLFITLLAFIVYNLPAALDQMWYEQYEMPVQEMKKLQGE